MTMSTLAAALAAAQMVESLLFAALAAALAAAQISHAGQPPRAYDGGGSYELSTASYDSSDGSLITVQKAWSDGQIPLGVATCAG